MNVKRYLKKQANQDRQAIMKEDNGKTLCALGIEYPEKKRPSRRIWIARAASLVTSLAVVLACVFMFCPFGAQTEKFLEENFVTEDSTVEKMNTELHDFSLTFAEDAFQIYITRTYDSISNKVLYYQLAINKNDNAIRGDIYITCNANYHYSDFTFSKTPISEILPKYAITYQIESAIDPQYGLEKISCKAEIKGQTDHIYITKYDELIFDNHTFLDSVQSFIHAIEK